MAENLVETLSTEEGARLLEERRILGDKLVEKFHRTDVGNVPYGKKVISLDKIFESNAHHARCIAMAIQNQENLFRRFPIHESTLSTNIATTPENVLKVVMLGMANSIRPLAFTEWPLQTTNDALFWVDRTFETTKRGVTAGQYYYEVANEDYAGEENYIETTGTGAAQYDINTGFTGLIPGQVAIILDGKLVAIDNRNGGYTRFGTTITTGAYNECIYATGHVKVEFTSVVSSPSVILVKFHWNSESKTLWDANVGTMSLSVRKKLFNARPMPLAYNFSDMSALMLNTTGLGDAHDILVSAVADEHAKARDYRAVALARRVALQNGQYYFDADFRTAGEVADKAHAQKVTSRISDIGGDIFNDIKRGMVNTAIVGTRALTYMKKNDRWSDDLSMPRQGCYKAGMLGDIDVYVCPEQTGIINKEDAILTYKNPQENADISIAFGNLVELQAELRYENFETKGAVATVEDKLIIEPKFLRLLTFQNLPTNS